MVGPVATAIVITNFTIRGVSDVNGPVDQVDDVEFFDPID
jgi:hypothetical protein